MILYSMFLCVSSTSRPLSIIITPSEASKLEWESHSLNSIKCIMCVYPKTAANNETDNIPLVRINIIFDFLFRPLFSCFRRINQESEVLPLEFVLGELLFCDSTAWLAIVFGEEQRSTVLLPSWRSVHSSFAYYLTSQLRPKHTSNAP